MISKENTTHSLGIFKEKKMEEEVHSWWVESIVTHTQLMVNPAESVGCCSWQLVLSKVHSYAHSMTQRSADC